MEQLLASMANYTASVNESLTGVRNLIEQERFADAAQLMTSVTTAQAEMSLRLQGAMQKLAA